MSIYIQETGGDLKNYIKSWSRKGGGKVGAFDFFFFFSCPLSGILILRVFGNDEVITLNGFSKFCMSEHEIL